MQNKRADEAIGLLWWALTVFWAAQIFVFSTERFGGAESRPLLVRILQQLNISLPPSLLDAMHAVSRKAAHVGEYSVFGFLLFRSTCGSHPQRYRVSTCLATVAACSLYAATDEFHQHFVAGRHSSVSDWMLDTFAAILAIALTYAYHRTQIHSQDH